MIYSMTGFAVTSTELETGYLSLELRSVNSRYLDLVVRMPDEMRALEPAIRETISARASRGKIECRINFSSRAANNSGAQLNQALLQQLAKWNNEIQVTLPNAQTLSVADVLRWNGILESNATPADKLNEIIITQLNQLVIEFSASRAREGEKLKEFLLQRVVQIEALRIAVAPHIPAAIANYEGKMRARLREALGSDDDERVRQEITLYASKIDVDEELSRLQGHLTEIQRILAKGGAVGKRLDFLMQELNREANTLGSKSVDAEVSRTAMEMKVLIEQMREQIQNLE
ncbi:MAG: YicC/YloC family endoribonuclease [Gallionellaceae bacterium]|nr:YicC/YloC family endoribonuclease [Gallionellaceae bacterium]